MRKCDGTCDTCSCEVWEPQTDRDTHFKGFARALLTEMIDKARPFNDFSEYEQIIAQRAYDLVDHVVEHYNSTYHLTTVPFLKDTVIRSIPDMPELPQAD